jgi:hypothetical protein
VVEKIRHGDIREKTQERSERERRCMLYVFLAGERK